MCVNSNKMLVEWQAFGQQSRTAREIQTGGAVMQ